MRLYYSTKQILEMLKEAGHPISRQYLDQIRLGYHQKQLQGKYNYVHQPKLIEGRDWRYAHGLKYTVVGWDAIKKIVKIE